MSIINRVLSQLERRGVQVDQDMVRAVPPPRSARMPLLLAALLLLTLAAWWWQQRGTEGVAKLQQAVAFSAPRPVPNVVANPSGVPVSAASAVAVSVTERAQPAPKPVPQPAPKPVPKAAPKPVPKAAPKPAPQPAPKPVPQPAPKPVPKAVPPPKAVASVPPKPAVLAVQDKPRTAAPSANRTVAPKQDAHSDKPATTAPVATDEIPMKQISRSQQAEAEFRRGVELMQRGRSSDAIASYRAALQLDGAHDAARQALVGLLLEDKLGDEAERLLRERLDSRPQHTGFAMLLARLQVERGATGEALVTLERSLAYAEAKADYLAFLAALQQRNNLHADAASHYQAALQLQPGNGAWLMGYGISLQALRRTEEAKAAYRQALESKTLSPDLKVFIQRKLNGL
ncbi:MAG: tetratricopeptide repeat protein [Gallionella sp.]|jgi:MSHA biogenesis protein MshN|nr:tetratricopeptide repeat protein [Gallionella sp.]MCK9354264.1 tetratricopeptide repeat protein [Gallionella sp.]